MRRLSAIALLALAYAAVRVYPVFAPLATPVAPTPVTIPAGTSIKEVVAFRPKMSDKDRVAVSEAYAILSRAVAANPAVDPVFVTTESVRAAHRAAMLCVWRGVLGNEPGKYAGLREVLEGAVEGRIGKDDIPLNPALQQQAAQAFADIAASLR